MSTHDLPDPPPAPETRRRVKLYPYQWIGLSALALLPVLAAAGLFGASRRVERAAAGGLEVTVRYPARIRYEQFGHIELQVRNAGAAARDSVRVRVDTFFLSRFSSVVATPALEQAYELVLPGLVPGASRHAVVEIRAHRVGRHSGTLTVVAGDTVRVPLAVLVFP